MSIPRDYQTEAIVIKKTKLGEADRILTLFTLDMGRIQAVAKGVRRPKSKLAGHLELLSYSQVSLARGKNLDTISGSQTIDGFLPLKNDLGLTAYALYVIELVNQFTAENVENRPLFQLLVETMQRLCQVDESELALRYFELQLFNEVGYRPQLQYCVTCRQPLKPTNNYFSASAGGILCPDCGSDQFVARTISVNAIKVLRLLQNSDFATVIRLKLSPELYHELESIIRGYVKFLLERDVKSIAWLDTLKEQAQQIASN